MIEVQTQNSWLILFMYSKKELYGKAVEPIILTTAKKLGYSEYKLFGIRLACEEAVMNAIKHGNKEDISKKVKIGLKFKDNLEFFVEDKGEGFNWRAIPDPTKDENLELDYGRGIFLMKSFADKLFYNKKRKDSNYGFL